MSAFIVFQLEKEGPKKNWVFRKRIKLDLSAFIQLPLRKSQNQQKIL